MKRDIIIYDKMQKISRTPLFAKNMSEEEKITLSLFRTASEPRNIFSKLLRKGKNDYIAAKLAEKKNLPRIAVELYKSQFHIYLKEKEFPKNYKRPKRFIRKARKLLKKLERLGENTLEMKIELCKSGDPYHSYCGDKFHHEYNSYKEYRIIKAEIVKSIAKNIGKNERNDQAWINFIFDKGSVWDAEKILRKLSLRPNMKQKVAVLQLQLIEHKIASRTTWSIVKGYSTEDAKEAVKIASEAGMTEKREYFSNLVLQLEHESRSPELQAEYREAEEEEKRLRAEEKRIKQEKRDEARRESYMRDQGFDPGPRLYD